MVQRMSMVNKSLAKATKNHRRTLTTSDDISKCVVPFLHEIGTTFLTSTEPRFEITYGLVIRLQHLFYAYPSSYDERDSDPVADDLLIELANERKAAGGEWR